MGQVENTRTRLTRVGHLDRVVPFSDPIRSESLSLSLSIETYRFLRCLSLAAVAKRKRRTILWEIESGHAALAVRTFNLREIYERTAS